jgi:sporulation protein YlmC with PRC-barrel domain
VYRPFAAKLAILAGAAALIPATASAQDNQMTGQAQEQRVAEQCLQDLNTFAQGMSDDAYWMSGWGQRWGTPGPQPTSAETEGTTNETDSTAVPPRHVGTGPWNVAGGYYGIDSPRYQFGTLYRAAYVLAQRGDEQGCRHVVDALKTTYESHRSQLEDAGVDPQQVTTWREEQIALAEPVEEAALAGRLTIDDLTGTDVRNLEDEQLGTVTDVLLDAEAGDVSYVVVAHGGFFGIGEDRIAVPWDRFRATPGLNTLVLDVTEQDLEDAPSVDPETFGDPRQTAEQDREFEEYWSKVSEG